MTELIFEGVLKSLWTMTAAMKLKDDCYDNPRQHIKKQIRHFANKRLYNQSYGFSRSHVHMWKLDHKEGWAPNNWSFWTVVLEKSLESHLHSKEIRSVNPKGNQPWIFIGRADAEAEAPILWPLDAKSRLEKTLMMGKIEGKSRRRMRWLDGIINLMDMNLSKFWEIVKDRETWCATVQGIAKHLTWPSNWTEEAQVPAKKAFGDISSRDDG